jgi:hypothetical protein
VNIMEKTTTHRKKQFVSNAFKYMIAVSSIAGTLGIWNLLANKDLVNASAQTNPNGQTNAAVNQAPLPTLVPVTQVNMNDITKGNGLIVAATPLRQVTPPAATASASQSLTTNSQSNPVVLPPAPVTTTRSSRP